MDDIRIKLTLRLSPKEAEKLKNKAIKDKKTIQQVLKELTNNYVKAK